MCKRIQSPWVALLAASICLGLIVAGCGGGTATSATDPDPSAQFIEKGHENVIPRFGKESSVEEREEASAVLTENLKARAAGAFATQCKTLNKEGVASIPEAKGKSSCPGALKKIGEPLSQTKKARKDTLTGPISALRVKGTKGYALYHGNDGKNYAMPMGKENGSWLVSAIVTTEL